MPRTSPYTIVLSQAEQSELERRSRRYTSQYRDVVRAKVILLAAQGMENTAIAERLNMPFQIASKWRKRFFEERLPGLDERSRSGRSPVFPPRVGGRRKGDRL